MKVLTAAPRRAAPRLVAAALFLGAAGIASAHGDLPGKPARKAAVIARRHLLGAAALAPWWSLAGAEDGIGALERVRRRGTLSVAVYQEMPPFHVKGRGIDVELATALAEGLGVRRACCPCTPTAEAVG